MIGSIVGSPPFMSPEQASGKPLDFRSDIYSLGTVAFYLLSGQPPFPRDTPMQMVMAHAYEPVPQLSSLLSGIPNDLEMIIARCLEKDPDKRWSDADSLEKALAASSCANAWTEDQAAAWWRDRRQSQETTPQILTDVTPELARSPAPVG
jgi:serine/threonine-protein kinase